MKQLASRLGLPEGSDRCQLGQPFAVGPDHHTTEFRKRLDSVMSNPSACCISQRRLVPIQWLNNPYDKGNRMKYSDFLPTSSTPRRRGLLTGLICFVALVVVAACGGTTNGPSEKKLGFASYVPGNTFQGDIYKSWGDAIEKATDGRLSFRYHHANSLLSTADILSGVAAGRAEAGLVAPFYNPKQLPLSMVADLPFLGTNLAAKSETLRKLYDEFKPFQAEYEDQGVKLLATLPSSDMITGCKTELRGPEDLKGRSVRAGGLSIEAMTAAGAKVVSLAASEIREGISKGVIDCWSSATLDNAASLGLLEVTPFIYTTGYGSYSSTTIVMSMKTWKTLTDADKDAVVEASKSATQSATKFITANVDKACKLAKENGVTFKAFDDAQAGRWQAMLGKRINEVYAATHPSAQEFAELYEKVLKQQEPEHADFVDPVATCIGS